MKIAVRNGEENDAKSVASAVTIETSQSVSAAEAMRRRRSSGIDTDASIAIDQERRDRPGDQHEDPCPLCVEERGAEPGEKSADGDRYSHR